MKCIWRLQIPQTILKQDSTRGQVMCTLLLETKQNETKMGSNGVRRAILFEHFSNIFTVK